MAFHPKQITQFLQSRLGIILGVFLLGGFALAFYSYNTKQASAEKNAESHQIDKLDAAPSNATPAAQSQNDNQVQETDNDQSQRTYDRPQVVALPDLPPPPPPVVQAPAGTNPLYHGLQKQPPTPPPPPLMVAHYGQGAPPETPPGPPGGSPPVPTNHPMEGPPGEYDGPFAPYGRLLKCELVNTVDSSALRTPIIAFVTEDLWWNGKLIIPAGTEVHGDTAGGGGGGGDSGGGSGGKQGTPIQNPSPSSGGALRDRLEVSGDWFLIMPPYEFAPNGAELALTGIALDRENLTADDNGSWGITDGSYGIRGKVIDDSSNDRILEFLGDFIAGALPTLESQEVTTVPIINSNQNGLSNNGQSTSVYTTPRATLANGALQGLSTAVNQQVQNIADEIKRNGYYLRVPAGTQFYLYIEQTIDPTDAHIGMNFKNHTVIGAVRKTSPPNLFASFMRNLGKPQSQIVSPDETARQQEMQQKYIQSLQASQDNEKNTEEAQLQALMDQQDSYLKTVSKTQLQRNIDQATNMAPPTPPSNP